MQVRELPCQRFNRLTLAAEWVFDVIDKIRAGDLNFDRLCKGSRRHTVAGSGIERKYGIVASRPSVKQIDRAKLGLIARHRETGRRTIQTGIQKFRGIEW